MPKIADALLMFTPELWGQVERFQKFYAQTYNFAERDRRAVSGVGAHFEKSLVLRRLSQKLLPNLSIDRAELESRGATPADNAAELATVIEAAILELYSSIDCTVKVIRAIYGSTTRGFKDSTRGLFENIDKIDGLPDALRTAVKGATWFSEIRRLRDELTHLATGNVQQAADKQVVQYMHFGLKQGESPLVIDDIFAWMETMTVKVNSFAGLVFQYLNSTLSDRPIFQICGMVQGRVLHRWVSPGSDLTFNSGGCGSWIWFEQPENPTCPFKDYCGAYQNKAPPEGWETSA